MIIGPRRQDKASGPGAGKSRPAGYTGIPPSEWPPMSEILVPVSFGELLDKIAILQIKSERMTDPAKLANVRNELSAEHAE